MNKTKISWTNATWNPITGCSHVSSGCKNCYAERLSLRHKHTKKPWTAQNAAENVVLHPERLDQPLHWRAPRMVFVNSMSDLFHPLVPFTFIDEVMNVIGGTPKHTYQVLTKRPMRMLQYFTRANGYHAQNMHNLWLGVSVEDQATADLRIPILLQTPAHIRFLSCEPLLGAVDLSHAGALLKITDYVGGAYQGTRYFSNGIHWVIVGGESGPNFRPMNLDWARSIRDQCVEAKIPFFYKQGSALRSEQDTLLDGVEWHQFPKQFKAQRAESEA